MNDKIIIPDELEDMLQPGKSVRVFYNENNPNNKIKHIRAIVDGEYIVFRVWGENKKQWFYCIEWVYGFYLDWKAGSLSEVK